MEIKSIKIAGSIEGEARTLAKQMAKTGEKLLPLAFGDGNSIFVASDASMIRTLGAVEVAGIKYFFGFKNTSLS